MTSDRGGIRGGADLELTGARPLDPCLRSTFDDEGNAVMFFWLQENT